MHCMRRKRERSNEKVAMAFGNICFFAKAKGGGKYLASMPRKH